MDYKKEVEKAYELYEEKVRETLNSQETQRRKVISPQNQFRGFTPVD